MQKEKKEDANIYATGSSLAARQSRKFKRMFGFGFGWFACFAFRASISERRQDKGGEISSKCANIQRVTGSFVLSLRSFSEMPLTLPNSIASFCLSFLMDCGIKMLHLIQCVIRISHSRI